MIGIVRIALTRPYTFVVLALTIMIIGPLAALRIIWVGEVVSIGVMEIAMNAVDYAMGGMGVKSLFVARYWEAIAVAAAAGYLTAWPVNHWLLGRNMKKCH